MCRFYVLDGIRSLSSLLLVVVASTLSWCGCSLPQSTRSSLSLVSCLSLSPNRLDATTAHSFIDVVFSCAMPATCFRLCASAIRPIRRSASGFALDHAFSLSPFRGNLWQIVAPIHSTCISDYHHGRHHRLTTVWFGLCPLACSVSHAHLVASNCDFWPSIIVCLMTAMSPTCGSDKILMCRLKRWLLISLIMITASIAYNQRSEPSSSRTAISSIWYLSIDLRVCVSVAFAIKLTKSMIGSGVDNVK